jgi:hypothetical protein
MDAPQQLPQEYTLTNVNAYLREECPDEISALPPINSFAFTNTPELINNGDADREALHPICNMQLLLRNSTGEYTTYSPVYLCLGGEGNNRVGLNCNGRLYTFNLDNLSYVNFAKPVRRLLRSQKEVEVLREAEKRRPKAYGCYLFLVAGHVQSIHLYSGSKDDMRYASAWLARENDGSVKTARQKRLSCARKRLQPRRRLRRSDGLKAHHPLLAIHTTKRQYIRKFAVQQQIIHDKMPECHLMAVPSRAPVDVILHSVSPRPEYLAD